MTVDRPRSPLRLFLSAFMGLGVLFILLALGMWQWARRAEKEAYLAQAQARMHAPPKTVTSKKSWEGVDPERFAHQPVMLEGVFDAAKEVEVFFNASAPVGGRRASGRLVMTPFRLSDGAVVFVNRGFIPWGVVEKEPAGNQRRRIEGLARRPEKRTLFAGENDVAKRLFYVRNPSEIAAALNILEPLAPFFVDARGDASSWPRPLPEMVTTPNNHLSYALTWWALALIWGGAFLPQIWKSARKKRFDSL